MVKFSLQTLLGVMVLAVLLGAGAVFAQEDATAVADGTTVETTEEVVEVTEEVPADEGSDEVDPVIDEEVEIVEEIMVEEELTEAEIAEIEEQAEEITEEELAEEVLVGEIVLVTEDAVFIEDANGDITEVPTEYLADVVSGGERTGITSGGVYRGQKVTVVAPTHNTLAGKGALYIDGILRLRAEAAAAEQEFVVTESTKVVKNGVVTSLEALEDLSEEATVTVVTNEDGEVLAVTIYDEENLEEEETGSFPWIWVLVGVVVIVFAATRKKSAKDTVADM